MGEPSASRVRREPPPFRRVEVRAIERVHARLMRVTFGGDDLAGTKVPEPAASVRVLLPSPQSTELVIPRWNGNEFLLPGGRRPVLRTFTPLRFDARAGKLDVEIVLHGDGAASRWATTTGTGQPAAISGPGRGYTIDRDAPGYLIAGDETALPAIRQVLDALPVTTPAHVIVETGDMDARVALPVHPHASESWHQLGPAAPPGDAFVAAIRDAPITREHTCVGRGRSRGRRNACGTTSSTCAASYARDATVRGYWKHGRAGGGAS